ncbi:MAG: LacI family DNA-binding transcriptional regulator [Lentisphaeria bacterium]|nr:MAG: LacI family DNA-binding transcriptional regulator [Lentisphaeria bacterium]
MAVKAKITDVARVAGVSVTTVSHTLSGRRPVGEEVRGRVLRAIRELNYRPNYFAGGDETESYRADRNSGGSVSKRRHRDSAGRNGAGACRAWI